MTMDLTVLTEKKNRMGTKYFEDKEGKITAKECSKCSTIRTMQSFHRDRKGLGGKKATCKACAAIRASKYHERNKHNPDYLSKKRKRRRDWYYENKEQDLNKTQEWRDNNREHLTEYHKRRWIENRDYFDRYYRENRDKELARSRDYYRKHRERYKEHSYRWREINAEKYLKANKLARTKRKARKISLPDTLTQYEFKEIIETFGNGCAITGSSSYHLDHVIPLSSGHGGTTSENIVPLQSVLNMSKHNKCIFEWFADNRERFGLSQAKFDELIEYLAEINEMTTTEYEEYVRWCHDNPRTNEEIKADNERYGYKKPSIEIWREEVANKGRELVEA